MSWDVLVLNYGGSPPDVDEMAEAGEPDPLGSTDIVRNKISQYLDFIDWSDPSWGIYDGDGFTIEFNIGGDDPIRSLMLHVRGGGDDAIAALLQFAVPNGWSLFDCSTSEMIDAENPSREGWEGFQAFRDQAVERDRSEDET